VSVALDGVTIRPALPSDVDALFAMHQRSLRSLCHTTYSPSQLAAWFEGRSAAIYRKSIDGQRIQLAERDGEVLGFVGWAPGEITFLFVAESAAGQGLGKRLFALGLDEASRGFEGPLTVLSTLNARGFYESFGFVVEAEQTIVRGFERLRIDVLRMERR
jgi:ribosomal protein S18 acetylase RimI-like enzyme